MTAFPPLVESVLPSCEARWRRTEAALERITDSNPSAHQAEGREKPGRKSNYSELVREQAVRLYESGESTTVIARQLGMTRDAVRAVVKARGAVPGCLNAADGRTAKPEAA